MSQRPQPEESTLTTLLEILQAWTEDDFVSTIAKCTSALKRRKTLEPSIEAAVQRLLLQAYIQQEEYAKVVEWEKQLPKGTNAAAMSCRDLVSYAKYRLQDYDSVLKNVSKESTLEHHLLAQSQFNLRQASSAIKVYRELLRKPEATDVDTQMELLTNAIAVLVSSAIPYAPLPSSFEDLLEDAESFLGVYPSSSDLALNFGTLAVLTGQASDDKDWLQLASDHCDNDEDQVPIDINLQWSSHFWQKGADDIHYVTDEGTAPQKAAAALNQALLDHKALATQPHPKWNALQVTLYWYNRAVQQYYANQLKECQESCQSLKKSIGGKKAKKGDSTATTPATSSAPSWSQEAESWWLSRMDVLLAYVLHQQSKSSNAITKLDQRLEELQSQPVSTVRDSALAYVQLHRFSLENPQPTPQQQLKIVQSLPESLRSQPAVIATTEVLQQQVATSHASKKEKSPEERARECFEQAKYQEAADLYKELLPKSVSACNGDELLMHLDRVQALALSGQFDESTALWKELEPLVTVGSDTAGLGGLNGEALEQQALPRTAKSTTTIATVDNNASRRSKEDLLKQRAKKREAYLKDLEAKGKYDPDRPVKPDPERWLPKHERSRYRRRGGAASNRSAQGGSTQDNWRLDAAARRAGTVPSSAGPSTANLMVSQGGRKGGSRRR
eukprot:Nitzschia sp. Nitz4//scaffold172_size47551//22667//24685//NITZ4_007144-RA/size47551-processed-gene-0.17-mRNA-1//1//CDS//3329538759//2749//frame0